MPGCFRANTRRNVVGEGAYGCQTGDELLRNKRTSCINEDRHATSIVELIKKDGMTLGLIVSGGVDKGAKPKISNLRPGSIAYRCDAIAVGDNIVSVNGIKTNRLKHEEIVSLLKNADEKVILEVEYEVPENAVEGSLCVCPRVIQVRLQNENYSFGFTIRGGATVNRLKSLPLIITHIRPGSPADRDGTIKVGDRLLAIDSLNLSNATLQEAMTIINKQIAFDALLTIEYDVSVMDAVLNASGPLLVEIDKKPSVNLGISLTRLQRSEGNLVIESIKQASIAERCGALHVADHILAIDGVKVDHLTPEEAATLLKTHTGECIKLEVLPVSQMIMRKTRDRFGRVGPFCLPSPSSHAHNSNYNTISSYGGHSTSSSGNHLPSVHHVNYPSVNQNGNHSFHTSFSEASFSSSMAAVVACSQVCHTETTTVHLTADVQGFGLRMQCATFPTELLTSPAVVNLIDPGGPADRVGAIQLGDRVLAINGKSTEGLVISDVNHLLQKSYPRVVLEIEFDVAESVVPSSGTFTVKLAKGSSGLGITITSPKNRKAGDPLIISHIKKGSLAHRTGTLQPGDKLLAIENVRMDNCTIEDAAEILRNCDEIVKLRIKKDETFSEEPDTTKAVIYTVELIRHGGPLGITISGTEEPFDPIFISGLTEGGLAERTEAIHIGDRLMAINGRSLRGKPLSEAILLLQNSGDIVTLKIAKFPPTLINKEGSNNQNENHEDDLTFLNSFVAPSVDSAVDSWNSSALELSSNKNGGLENNGNCKDPENRDIAVCTNATWEELNQVHEPDADDTCSSRGDWSKVLEDLETCGQSQLLRQIEQSIMGSEQSLCSKPETEMSGRRTGTQPGSNDEELTFMDQFELYSSWDPLPIPIEVQKVTLFKDNVYEDFGFSVSDGLHERGVYVNRIRAGGPADLSGILQRYDRILQVNATKTHDFDCCLTVPLIAASGDSIELVISRPAFLGQVMTDSSTLGRNSRFLPWVDETDREECASPVPPKMLTKTL